MQVAPLRTAALCVLCSATVFGSASAESLPLVTERLESWVKQGFYNGCSVWVAQGDRVLLKQSFGDHDADRETYIASAGKWLGAATILALVDKGRLSLDDTVEKWLPEFRGDPKGKATLRQLFSHTSGFPPYQPDEKPVDRYQSCAESTAHILPLPLHHAVGTRFEYGGLAMQVAGRMAEIATGQEWETLFQENIAQPLGMTHTRFRPVDPGHVPMIAGGAVSTLHDYSRFLTMLADDGSFQGRQVLSPLAVREMMADQTRDAAVAREEFVERRRGNTHRSIYGLGMWREEIDADGEVTLCSSPGWAGTYPWIDKKHDIRGLIVAHVTDGAAKTFSSFWSSPVLMNMVRAELDWNLPRTLPGYASGTARANGADIAWEAAGSGPPVILIHGHSFDRRMWNPQFAQLSKKYRVIRYDIRGYGLSDMPVEGQSFLHADDVVALMDALKIPRANVVGLSLGAYIVADLLALYPDRLLTATMASGAVFNGPASHELGPQERALRMKEIESLRMNGVEKLKVSWRENLLREVKDQDTRVLVTAMIADWSAWQPLHIEPPFLLGTRGWDILNRRKTTNPVLWIAGERDDFRPAVRAFQQVLPDLRVEIIPGAGHLSNLEQPKAFTSALEHFLATAQP